MRFTAALGLAFGLAAALPSPCARATGPFDGHWSTRPGSIQVSGKPQEISLDHGVFSCRSCAPPYSLRADGSAQVVAGHGYMDHQAVRILGPASIERSYEKDGRVTSRERWSVSADGGRLTVRFESEAGGRRVTGTRTAVRVAPGPAGAHAISGAWQSEDLPDPGRASVRLTSSADGLAMQWQGRSVSVRFDGPAAPILGDGGQTRVALHRIDARSFQETDTRLGVVTDVIVWVLAADGQSIALTDTDPVHARQTRSILERVR